MKKRISALLALALLLSPALPTWAVGISAGRCSYFFTDAEGRVDTEQQARFEAWREDFARAHPQETADFDADAFFSRTFTRNPIIAYFEDPSYDPEDYLADHPLLEGERFEDRMLGWWLVPLWREDQGRETVAAAGYAELDTPYWKMMDCATLEEYLTQEGLTLDQYGQMVGWMADYLAQHPQQAAAFQADDYYKDHLAYPPGNLNMKMNWFQYRSMRYGEEEFALEIRGRWLGDLYHAWKQAGDNDALAQRYAEEFAAFDADAWFCGHYGGNVGVTKEEYMDAEGLAGEDAFRKAMFAEWINGGLNRFGGYVVTVDGAPIQFQNVRDSDGQPAVPTAVDGQLMVPIRTIAQALAFTVSWDQEAQRATCEKSGVTVCFFLGRSDATVTRDGATQTLSLDVPAYAERGRIYLPLRALTEALGHQITWNQAFQTAAIRT